MKFYNSDIATNDKVELVQISADREEDSALDWARSEKFPFYSVLAGDQKNLTLRSLGGRGIPSYVLIDKNGKEIARGHHSCIEKIKSL
ncbi:hypothetical protein Rhal01_00123 [Rubritalea halochordaticola]|uniref:Thioredoxin-like fold domain-containing protein n=1 Tax=Rubritalea halochordaticola TaxID=714537 RepID=A0ABP9UX88_9BACT